MIKTVETLKELMALDIIINKNTKVVHSGVFHAHDVFACLNKHGWSNHNVIRTRNTEVINYCTSKGATVVDVGMGEMDHHGWKGYRGLETMFLQKSIETSYSNQQQIDAWLQILESIGRIDCGEEAIDYVSSLVSSFNPCWNEPSSPDNYDKGFQEAVRFASMVKSNPAQFIAIKERELAREAGKAEATSIVDQALLTKGNTRLLKLPRFVPWQEAVVKYNTESGDMFSVLWTLFPSPDGTYRVQAVPKSADSFEFHAPVGAKPDDKGFVFVHPNRFICGYATKENAISAVRSW